MRVFRFLACLSIPLTRGKQTAIAARAGQLRSLVYVVAPDIAQMLLINGKPELRRLYGDAWLNVCGNRIVETFARCVRLARSGPSSADTVERRAHQTQRPRSGHRRFA